MDYWENIVVNELNDNSMLTNIKRGGGRVVSILIPAYNEEKSLPVSVQKCRIV